MIQKTLVIIALLFILVSCKKEDEYISFIIATESSQFDTTNAVLRGVIVAPGKVNISECAFVIYNISDTTQSSTFSFGEIKNPGKIEAKFDTLQMGQAYNFYLYAKSNGQKIRTEVQYGETVYGGGGK
jgi:hypothetical protein